MQRCPQEPHNIYTSPPPIIFYIFNIKPKILWKSHQQRYIIWARLEYKGLFLTTLHFFNLAYTNDARDIFFYPHLDLVYPPPLCRILSYLSFVSYSSGGKLRNLYFKLSKIKTVRYNLFFFYVLVMWHFVTEKYNWE